MTNSTIRRTAAIIVAVLAGLPSATGQSGPAQIDHEKLSAFRADKFQSYTHEQELIAQYLEAHDISLGNETTASRLRKAIRFREGRIRFIEALNTPYAAATINASHVYPESGEGYDIDGSTQTVGVWDAGRARDTHVEFDTGSGSRVSFGDSCPYYHDHSSSMAGVVGATGVWEKVRGMAVNASIVSYDWGNDTGEMAQAADNGLLMSNHAYGSVMGWGPTLTIGGETLPGWYGDTSISEDEDVSFGRYTSDSAEWDELATLAPTYLMVKAAGNDRGRGQPDGTWHWAYDSKQGWVKTDRSRPVDGGLDGFDCLIGDSSTSKNVLSVGAVDHIELGYSSPSDVVLQSYSAWGPTDDGRIKPDLVTSGEGVNAVKSGSDEDYGGVSGTSLASAVATGGIALINERIEQVGYSPLLSSTMRALLIHTANEAGPAPGPDYMHGWGLMDVYAAVNVITADAMAGGETHMFERTLNNHGDVVLTVESTGHFPLTATIAWLDRPGPASDYELDPPDLRLVNDLDLRVTGPDGTYMPWVLDPSNPSNPATLGDNYRDNVEQVVIDTPVEGAYEIRITHKGSLSGGSQSVSVVVGGNVNAALYADDDGDSIYATFEDVDNDGNILDDDTNFNGIPDYLDYDDDGDGLSTYTELDGCVSDGMPMNPPDLNGNGVPDYLDAALLPVELVSFAGRVEGDGIVLEWTTASETNTAGFGIEHALPTGDFAEVAFVEAAGNATSERLYRHSVGRLDPGQHRFRLATIDMDGSRTEGPTVNMVVDLQSQVDISAAYPNPFKRACRFTVTAASEQDVTIDLVDLLGREVKRIEDHLLPLTPLRVMLDGSDLPAGSYLLRISGDSFTKTKPITIAR